ncbi:MAG TPA: TrmH family RNA methyltransferase [Bacteroidetes bacterium]|nr:TrmH family RNA methyltransferase [Bacteroidota bacterium]
MIPERQAIEKLKNLITEERYSRFIEVLNNRTRYATVVLEDIFQPHNASACLRSCDLFGIQDVHIIENDNEYKVNPDVAVGAFKWLTITKYNQEKNNTKTAIESLKKQGYRIIATTPHKNDVELRDFDITKGKFALVFGSEMPGITETVQDYADEFLRINMFGFTESFNISVSVALTLYELSHKLRNSNLDWKLTENEYDKILLEWLKKNIKISEKAINKYLNEQ